MNLTLAQRCLIEKIVNVFETGRAGGDYGAITIYKDGPHGVPQLTYGRSRTTEYGKLRLLVERYVEAEGIYAGDLARYAACIGAEPLTGDAQFRSLLRTAGRTDPVMRRVQNAFVDEELFLPAMQWAADHAFTLPLSALVIYDSFTHSGTIRPLIHRAFPDPDPDTSRNERAWTTAYVKARHAFLSTHPRASVRETSYRTSFLAKQIQHRNWHLEQRPIRVDGVGV